MRSKAFARLHVAVLGGFAVLAVVLPTSADDAAVPDTVLSRYRMSQADLRRLEADGVEFQVEARHGRQFDVLVPRREAQRTAFAATRGRLLEADVHDEILRVPAATRASYHDYAAVKAHVEKLEKDNPDLIQVEIYGQSKENRDLYAVQLASPLPAANFKPGLLLTGGTHGNELIGVEACFNALDQTVALFKSGDPVIKAALEEYTLYFIPVVNADGFVRRDRYANGIDPNRDFPWPQDPSKKPNEAIQALMDFTTVHNVVGSIDWHSAIGVVGYPWSYQESPVSDAKDRAAFQKIAAAMGHASGYRYGQIPDIIYVAQGSSGDWDYWQRHALAFVIEVAGENVPPTSAWPQRFKENFGAYKAFLQGMTEEQQSGRR